jgi:hypothetical protein
MKKITIVFTKSNRWFRPFSYLIRWWTKKPYSHVALKFHSHGEEMYYHASESKVNYEHVSIFKKKHKTVVQYDLEIPEHLRHNLVKACLAQAGQPYSIPQNIAIFTMDVAHKLGFNLKLNWGKGVWNCSELIYKTVLKPLLPHLNYNPDTIKPEHIEYIIKSHKLLSTEGFILEEFVEKIKDKPLRNNRGV